MKKTVFFVGGLFLAICLIGQNEFSVKIDKTKSYEAIALEITGLSLVDFINYEKTFSRGDCFSISLGEPKEIIMKSFSFEISIQAEEILKEMEKLIIVQLLFRSF
jgi:hypothetical protein